MVHALPELREPLVPPAAGVTIIFEELGERLVSERSSASVLVSER